MLVVAFELGLDLLVGVVQHKVVAAPGCTVAAAGNQFTASEATQCLLCGQAPRRHVDLVVHAPGDDGHVRVTAQKVHDDFLANAGDVHGTELVARHSCRDAYPARAVLVLVAIAVPRELDFDAAQSVGVDVRFGGVGAGADHQGGFRAAGFGFGLGGFGAQGFCGGLHFKVHHNAPLA